MNLDIVLIWINKLYLATPFRSINKKVVLFIDEAVNLYYNSE